MCEPRARAFLEAWNAGDLDEAMRFVAEGAVYEDAAGRRHEGRAEIRAAFEPTFAGTSGRARFEVEAVHAAAGAVTMTWTCELSTPAGARRWRGVDVLEFDERGLLTRKLTYAKARLVLVTPG